jgi:K+ transporter
MSEDADGSGRSGLVQSSVAALGFAALGVVFADIGTSPLYALQTVLNVTGAPKPRYHAGCILTDLLDTDHHHVG